MSEKNSFGSLCHRIHAIAPVLAPLVLNKRACASLRDVSSLGATDAQKQDIAKVVDSLRETSAACQVCSEEVDLVSSALWHFDSKNISLQIKGIQVRITSAAIIMLRMLSSLFLSL